MCSAHAPFNTKVNGIRVQMVNLQVFIIQRGLCNNFDCVGLFPAIYPENNINYKLQAIDKQNIK